MISSASAEIINKLMNEVTNVMMKFLLVEIKQKQIVLTHEEYGYN